jgi:hypothetical protein
MIKASILFLWIGAVFDPVGQFFNIRYVAVLLAALSILQIVILSGGILSRNGLTMRSFMILFFGFITPFYGLFIYFLRAGGGDFIDTSYIAAGFLMCTSILYKNQEYCLFGIRSLVITVRILALLIISIFTSQLISSSGWYWIFVDGGGAYIGQRSYADVNFPYIYFVASPLLIFLVAYEFNKSMGKVVGLNVVNLFISIFALFLSGTRFNMLISILFSLFFFMIKFGPKRILSIYILIVLVFFHEMIAFGVKDLFGEIFSVSEFSNSQKLSYFKEYSKIFSNPVNLIFGQGYNAHVWSPELREMLPLDFPASKTELTYLEFFRVYGVLFGVVFLLVLFVLLKRLSFLEPEMRWMYYGLAIFLVSASLNPYIFSVNGMLPLALFSSIIIYNKRIKTFGVAVSK